MRLFSILLLFALAVIATNAQTVDIEGHRGARGHAPENTIPSFLKALELGVNTLELDVVISKDGKVVVSHEPFFSHLIATDPTGNAVTEENEKGFNIYKLNYDEIKKFDVGRRGNQNFPQQVPQPVYKPLLSDVFEAVKKYEKLHKLPTTRYNIEIKSTPATDGIFHPVVAEYVRLVLDVIAKAKQDKNVIIQSFDVRALQELHKVAPKIPTSFLVENTAGLEKNLELLGFLPNIYSPQFRLVDKSLADALKAKGIKLVPWTANELSDLERMKSIGVDGIISDYPDRAVKVFVGQTITNATHK